MGRGRGEETHRDGQLRKGTIGCLWHVMCESQEILDDKNGVSDGSGRMGRILRSGGEDRPDREPQSQGVEVGIQFGLQKKA